MPRPCFPSWAPCCGARPFAPQAGPPAQHWRTWGRLARSRPGPVALRPCYNCRRCLGRRVAGKRVLIARGRGGRERLRDGLTARGAEVAYLEVYQRAKPAVSQAVMERAWRDETPDAVVVTSLAGLNNLIEMTPASEQTRLRETALIVMSERIERQAMEQGFFPGSRGGGQQRRGIGVRVGQDERGWPDDQGRR